MIRDGDRGNRGRKAYSQPQLLDAANTDFGLKPFALFNRFDLAPADWKHCGEYRVIYSLRAPNGRLQGKRRFLLIFEAMVPNPYFDRNSSGQTLVESEAGCRPLAEFWADLSNIRATAAKRLDRAKRLSKLYYDGVDGRHDSQGVGSGKSRVELPQSWRRRRARTGPGQHVLRGWLAVARMADATDRRARRNSRLSFVPETVKDNPIAELYQDDLTGTALAASNMSGPLQALHGDFIAHF